MTPSYLPSCALQRFTTGSSSRPSIFAHLTSAALFASIICWSNAHPTVWQYTPSFLRRSFLCNCSGDAENVESHSPFVSATHRVR